MTPAEILKLAGKICTGCEQEFPATVEYFYRKSSTKDGLQHRCKKCASGYGKKYYSTDAGRNTVKRYQQTINYKQYRVRYLATVRGHLREIFAGIKQRCTDPNSRAYKWYGGRGIRLCFTSDEFVDYVIKVLQVDPRGLDCDRINNDGNYEPGNIRFVTHRENQQNKKRSE